MEIDLDSITLENGYYRIGGKNGMYILQLQPDIDLAEGYTIHSWVCYYRKNRDPQEEEIFRTPDIAVALRHIVVTESYLYGPYNVQILLYKNTKQREYLDSRVLTKEQLADALMLLPSKTILWDVFSKPYRERIAAEYKWFISEVLKNVRKECQHSKIDFILACHEERIR